MYKVINYLEKYNEMVTLSANFNSSESHGQPHQTVVVNTNILNCTHSKEFPNNIQCFHVIVQVARCLYLSLSHTQLYI